MLCVPSQSADNFSVAWKQFARHLHPALGSFSDQMLYKQVTPEAASLPKEWSTNHGECIELRWKESIGDGQSDR